MHIVLTRLDAHRCSPSWGGTGFSFVFPAASARWMLPVPKPLTRPYPIIGTITGGPIAAVNTEENCRARYPQCHLDSYQ